jgi:hypothetical protein
MVALDLLDGGLGELCQHLLGGGVYHHQPSHAVYSLKIYKPYLNEPKF